MWCINQFFFCHIDLKPLGLGGSQNGTLCAGSPKDSSSHWGSSPHGFIIRVGYSRFHWNITSLLFTWPFESFQGHQVDYIKLILSPITSRYYITKTTSYMIFSCLYFFIFSICKYKDVLFVWACLRLHVIHAPGYNRRPMGTGSATEPRSDATR